MILRFAFMLGFVLVAAPAAFADGTPDPSGATESATDPLSSPTGLEVLNPPLQFPSLGFT